MLLREERNLKERYSYWNVFAAISDKMFCIKPLYDEVVSVAKGYEVYSSVFLWNLRQAFKLFMLVGRSYVRPLTGVCSTRSGGE